MILSSLCLIAFVVGALALPQGTAQISDPNAPSAPAYTTGAAQIWDPNAPSAPASTPDAAQTSDPNASSASASTTDAAQTSDPNAPSASASTTDAAQTSDPNASSSSASTTDAAQTSDSNASSSSASTTDAAQTSDATQTSDAAQTSDPNASSASPSTTDAASTSDPNAPQTSDPNASSSSPSTTDAAQTSDPNASSAPPSTTDAAQIWNPNDPSVPASVTYEGPYTLPKIPTECTASIIPFQTDLWVHGAQLSIEDDASWMSADRTNWTFSSNTSGIVFADPYFSAGGGCHSGRPCPTVANRTEPNSFTLTTSINDGGLKLIIFAFQNNGSLPANQTSYSASMTSIPNDKVTFEVSIQGSVVCAHPVGGATCASGKIERTLDAWSAYGVDEWLQSWYDKRSSSFAQAGGMIKAFQSDFRIGSGQTCTIGNQCNYVTSCQDLPNQGNDPDSAKIYLAWIAMQNLSDMFTYLYQTMQIGELDTLTQIQSIALQFHSIKTSPAPHHPPLVTVSGVFGAISGLLALVGFGPASGAFGAVAGTLGAINGQINKPGAQTPDPQFADNSADLASTLGVYVGGVRTHVENAYTGIFTDGTNITSLLSHGSFVNRTDLNLDCNKCLPASQRWMEQYLALKMINYIWWTQNVFITFMPYGQVTQVDSKDNTTFTESACASNFLSKEPDITVCNTDDYGWGTYLGPGMARLTWMNPAEASKNKPNGDGSIKMSDLAPGVSSSSPILLNTTGTSKYTFRARDVIESSVRGFAQGGFDTDNMGKKTTDLLSQFAQYRPDNPSQETAKRGFRSLQGMFESSPTDAGMFNLPVCVMYNLNYWPTYFSTKNRPATNGYCICSTPWSVDMTGRQFSTAAPPDLAHRVTNVGGVAGDIACQASFYEM